MCELLFSFVFNGYLRCIVINELVCFVSKGYDFVYGLVVFMFFEKCGNVFRCVLEFCNKFWFNYIVR